MMKFNFDDTDFKTIKIILSQEEEKFPEDVRIFFTDPVSSNFGSKVEEIHDENGITFVITSDDNGEEVLTFIFRMYYLLECLSKNSVFRKIIDKETDINSINFSDIIGEDIEKTQDMGWKDLAQLLNWKLEKD